MASPSHLSQVGTILAAVPVLWPGLVVWDAELVGRFGLHTQGFDIITLISQLGFPLVRQAGSYPLHAQRWYDSCGFNVGTNASAFGIRKCLVLFGAAPPLWA
jgi:hypothetical protein